MKKLYYILILFISMTFVSQRAEASHAMGVDLSYQWLFGDSYLVTLTFYRDCSGTTAPTSASVNINGCGQNDFLTLDLVGAGVEVSPLCAAELANSTCNGGTIPGVEQYTYQALYDFQAQGFATPNCADWNISYSLCCRNEPLGFVTNLVSPSVDDIYIEAILNNLDTDPTTALYNSSPQFTSLPVPYICQDEVFNYNHGAVDSDGDSLVFSLIPAQDGPYPGTDILYNAPASFNYPIVSNSGVNTFDTQTGALSVDPDGSDDLAVMTILVEEYRDGVLIGSTMRDIQVVVQVCTNVQPQSSILGIENQVGGVSIDSNSVELCPGEALSFELTYSDGNATDEITLTTNLGVAIPGATFNVTGTNPVTGTFSWTPTAADAGFKNFIVTVQDDGCPILGSQVFSYDIRVQEGTYAGPDQTLCSGGIPAQLNAGGGSVFNWTAISGDAITGANFSCNPCSNPIPTPANTTEYEVVSDLSSLCKNKDTVVINVVAPFANTIESNQTICLNEAVNLPVTPATGTYTYSWSPIAGLSNPTIANPLASPTATTTYTAVITNTATGCAISNDVEVAISGVGPRVTISEDTSICSGGDVPLEAVAMIAPGVCGPGAACGGGTTDMTYGTGTLSASNYYVPFNYGYDDQRIQILYTAAELATIGMFGNTISAIAFDIASFGTNASAGFNGFNIKMGCYSGTDLPGSFVTTGLTQVLNPTNFAPSSTIGWENIAFDTPYDWDGTSSLIIEICHDGSGWSSTKSSNPKYHVATGTKTLYARADGSVGCTLTSPTGTPNRANIRFTTCNSSAGSFTYSWNDAFGNTATPTATNVTSSFTYVVDVEDGSSGCFGSASMDVTVGGNFTLPAMAPLSICYGDNTALTVSPSVPGAYNYSWTPSNTLIGNFGQSPTASPTASTDYTVLVSDGACERTETVSVSVGGAPVTATIDKLLVCPGETVQVGVGAVPTLCQANPVGCSGATSTTQVGTGAVTSTSTIYTPFKGGWHDGRTQILYTAADMLADGMTAGTISEIALNVLTKNSSAPYNNFTIQMGGFSLAAIGGFQAGLTTVFSPQTVTTTAGWNTYVLTTPYDWNGECDLVIQICFDNSAWTSNDYVQHTTASYNATVGGYTDFSTLGGCEEVIDGTPSTLRPNLRFTYCTPSLPVGADFTWTGGTVADPLAQTTTGNPVGDATYTVSVVDPGAPTCPSTSQVSVEVDSTIVMDAQVDRTNSCNGEPNINISSNVVGSAMDQSLVCGVNGTGCGFGFTDYSITPNTATVASSVIAVSPFQANALEQKKIQYLWLASDLTAAGVTSGSISAIQLSVATKNTKKNDEYSDFRISMGCTGLTQLNSGAGFQATTQVYSSTTQRVRTGNNNYVLAAQYDWDGTSNLIIEFCWENNGTLKNDFINYETVGYNCATGRGNATGTGSCNIVANATSNSRPVIDFRVCSPPPTGLVYSWSPSTGLSDPAIENPVFTPDGSSHNYTVTVTGGICPLTDSVQVVCVVPLELLKFTAGKTSTRVNLNWKTTGIDDLNYFDVQRSSDGDQFTTIGRVNKNDLFKYDFVDGEPIAGMNYYRLKAVKNSEGFDYSEILKVNFDKPTIVNVYPNPFSYGNSFYVELTTKGDFIEVQLVDLLGRELETQFFDAEEGGNVIEYNTNQLSEGTYIYKVKTQEGESIGKVIMNK